MDRITAHITISAIILAAALSLPARSATLSSERAPHTFEAGKGAFMLDGSPYVVKAAELHYPRIPREYWEHRIEMCKALGMNTICLYVFWNAIEQREGEFDFTGQNDVRQFIELCRKHDMNVILRPGPYVCAEWEMGGLPWWLLKKKDIKLRQSDPYFLERVDKFNEALAGQIGDLTIDQGGPIIMVQVENEYGSYGDDRGYVATIRDIVRRHFGDNVLLFQCDWASNFEVNGLDDLIWTMNFGTGANIDDQFRRLREIRPDAPLMCSEFWSGWFDKWGANHETRPADDMTAGIDEMLSKGISLSLYMTHGGTNWGHWSGANSPGYAPDVTSYDYDAPIDEQGAPTDKYHKLRSVMARYADSPLPEIPDPIPTAAVPQFTFTEYAPLWENLPTPLHTPAILTMEECDQGFGSMIYSTPTPATAGASTLTVSDPHDYAMVYLDGRLVGSLDRRLGQKQLELPPLAEGQRLDIFVEAMGRINFGRAIKDFKGITDSVTIATPTDTVTLRDWNIYCLPDEYRFYTDMTFTDVDTTAVSHRNNPGVYRGTFTIDNPADTWLDFSDFGKGVVYVNGIGIGRIWNIGPQQTLYVPGAWLRRGINEVLVFDIVGPQKAVSEGRESAVLDRLLSESPTLHRRAGEWLDLSDNVPAISGKMADGNGWQKIPLPHMQQGRYLCLSVDSVYSGSQAAIAELYLLDADGRRISREPWSVVYADSEDVDGVNRAADKLFDLQESTFWSTAPGNPLPASVVIDMGATHRVSGVEYLPRMEPGAPGAVKDFRLYISAHPFNIEKSN